MKPSREQQERYMREAMALARAAQETGDVPVGCVIVRGEEIVGRGQNRREAASDATAHAELEAIRMASQALGRWNLSDCALYVTLEPCPMCAGAIWNARSPGRCSTWGWRALSRSRRSGAGCWRRSLWRCCGTFFGGFEKKRTVNSFVTTSPVFL